jgi:hypothetical protein
VTTAVAIAMAVAVGISVCSFNEGTNALGGAQDIDAFVAAFAAAEPNGIAVPAINRIVAVPVPVP